MRFIVFIHMLSEDSEPTSALRCDTEKSIGSFRSI